MGSRDLLFKDQRIIVFYNDCFWYRHKDCHSHPSSEAPAFWTARAEGIQRRNVKTFRRLTLKGWTVAITWSCQNEGEDKAIAEPRRYLSEYLRTIYLEMTRLIILLIR